MQSIGLTIEIQHLEGFQARSMRLAYDMYVAELVGLAEALVLGSLAAEPCLPGLLCEACAVLWHVVLMPGSLAA